MGTVSKILRNSQHPCYPIRSLISVSHAPILVVSITLYPSCVLVYFAAQAGLQSLFARECSEHPYGGEIQYRASVHAWAAFDKCHRTQLLIFVQGANPQGGV